MQPATPYPRAAPGLEAWRKKQAKTSADLSKNVLKITWENPACNPENASLGSGLKRRKRKLLASRELSLVTEECLPAIRRHKLSWRISSCSIRHPEFAGQQAL
jgi:hypothetical protein